MNITTLTLATLSLTSSTRNDINYSCYKIESQTSFFTETTISFSQDTKLLKLIKKLIDKGNIKFVYDRPNETKDDFVNSKSSYTIPSDVAFKEESSYSGSLGI